MKKFFLTVCAVAMVCFLASGALAFTYTFPNNTEVQAWFNNAATTAAGANTQYVGWYDRIGGDIYEVFGADLTAAGTLSIFTNLPSTGTGVATVADLFIDVGCDKDWDLAIKMSGENKGKVYTIDATSDYKTSRQIYGSGNVYYGGRYDADNVPGAPRDAQLVPTQISATAGLLDSVTLGVSWNDPSGKDGTYRIDIANFTSLVPSGKYGYLWGSGDCANDTSQGCVPLPGAVLLLGAGLVRLAAYARRRRQV